LFEGAQIVDREHRVYRFTQDTRHGPRVIAESASVDDMTREITRYVARRMIERERSLAADGLGAKAQSPTRRRTRGIPQFLLGVVLGVAAVFIAAWIAAGRL